MAAGRSSPMRDILDNYQGADSVTINPNAETHISVTDDSENRPLLGGGDRSTWNLNRTLSLDYRHGQRLSQRSLRTFPGVFSPVALSMFSTVLFLRLGFIVGNAGLLYTLLQFALAYIILYLTILSICAISTNGAIEGGGAYYMISRALGPEFGGSIGLLFFLANIFSCALYITGFVEGVVDNFGPGGSMLGDGSGIPGGTRWWNYLYCSMVLAFCLLVCIIGAAMFARTSVFILLILVVCTLSVVVSMIGQSVLCIPFPSSNTGVVHANASRNESSESCGNWTANFTGFNTDTFVSNLFPHFSIDYIAGNKMGFASVFAVLFSSVTGIMNGANMSGELKDPSKAIPKGTLSAAAFTLAIYIVLSFFTAFTCEWELLVNNYNYLQSINYWPPFVVIGIFAATLSAALGNLIGASRVLEALARDELFWVFLKPATVTTKNGNPYVAVLISWGLVQVVLLIGSLNAIAPMAAELFLLSYASTNLACLALDLASAPNFRPTFKYFSWHTSLLGMLGCMVMCFFISVEYASGAIVAVLIIAIVLHLRSFPITWGSISQALIFHQVRKYLLMLDRRKDHVKFWRPQILLFVANPRANCELIDFVNDLKKGGLYVLGHVEVGDLDKETDDPCQSTYSRWQSLVDYLKVKAFIELTLADSVRNGMQHLIRVSGLGGMKPNTICMGFYDHALPEDSFAKLKAKRNRRQRFYSSILDPEGDNTEFYDHFPLLRTSNDEKKVAITDYVHMIYDAVKLSKNVCLFRHFGNLDKEAVFKSSNGKDRMYIDVWPVNFFRPDTANYFDNTCLFMLQLACILHMVPGWKSKTKLRIFMCIENPSEDTERKKVKLANLLRQLRIPGKIQMVTWKNVTEQLEDSPTESDSDYYHHSNMLAGQTPDNYLQAVNELVRNQCQQTAVTFCYLPKAPEDESTQVHYLSQLTKLTEDFPPTVLVHGLFPVTSTTL